jgi:hypothetical protein
MESGSQLTDRPRMQHTPSSERRDDRRTIQHWLRNTLDHPVPLLATFDLSPMRGDWPHRFLICSDHTVETAAFVAYGSGFADLLNLPDRVTSIIPLNLQIPERYRPLFTEGCSNAINKQVPVQFSGSFDHDFKAELFRAVFLPIRLHPNWSKWLIYGSFNCRVVLSVDKRAL